MKYYLYISDSKIEMLYNQIATSTDRSREASIGFDVKVLKGEIKQGRGVPENSVTRLNDVVEALRKSDAVGSIDAPKKYIGGTLQMAWSSYGFVFSEESPITFWSYSASGIAMALAGSKYNLLGEQRPGNAHSHSLTPPMVQWFLDNLQDPVPDSAKGLGKSDEKLDEYDIANGTWLAATQAKGIKESTEFVARVLHDTSWPEGFRGSDTKRILLASPLYVASVD